MVVAYELPRLALESTTFGLVFGFSFNYKPSSAELFLAQVKKNTAILFSCCLVSMQCIFFSTSFIVATSCMSWMNKSACVVLAVVFWQLFC